MTYLANFVVTNWNEGRHIHGLRGVVADSEEEAQKKLSASLRRSFPLEDGWSDISVAVSLPNEVMVLATSDQFAAKPDMLVVG